MLTVCPIELHNHEKPWFVTVVWLYPTVNMGLADKEYADVVCHRSLMIAFGLNV